MKYLRLEVFNWQGHLEKYKRNVDLPVDIDNNVLPSQYTWLMTRQFEGTYGDDWRLGVWPINYYRVAKSQGEIDEEIFSHKYGRLTLDSPWPKLSEEDRQLAQGCRMHHYFRVFEKTECIQLLGPVDNLSVTELILMPPSDRQRHRDRVFNRPEVRLAIEITKEWYSPEAWRIPDPEKLSAVIGSHAVPIVGYRYTFDDFQFENRWGHWLEQRASEGTVSWETIRTFGIGLWGIYGKVVGPPVPFSPVRKLIHWECAAPSREFTVHGFEICEYGRSIAWAFCRRKGNYIEIDEFFVLPEFRRQGCAKAIATQILRLSDAMQCELRAWIDYADAGGDNRPALESIMELLSLELQPSPMRLAAAVGTSYAKPSIFQIDMPEKPAMLLDRVWQVARGTAASVGKLISRDKMDSIDDDVQVDVLVASSRGLDASGEPTSEFSDTLSYWLRTFLAPASRRPASDLITHSSYLPIPESDFVAQIDSECVLYIHGFYNTFDECVHRAAQLSRDLRRRVVAYSWPSLGKVKGYARDGEQIYHCSDHLRRILSFGFKRVLAHSMGTKLLLRAITELNFHKSNELAQTVLLAGDIDRAEADRHLTKASKCLGQIVSYCSEYDLALLASAGISDSLRLGLLPPMFEHQSLACVEISNLRVTDWSNHSYFCRNLAVITDLKETFDGKHLNDHMYLTKVGNHWALRTT